MTRILLADDDGAVRSAMVLFIKHKLGVTEIDEASNADELYNHLSHNQPDLLLLDWQFPGLDITRIYQDFQGPEHQMHVVVMSMQSENERWALASGADAFLNKRASGEYVLDFLKKHLP